MIDVDKCVKDYTGGLTDLNDKHKKNFSEMATAMGNFLNCIWEQKEIKDKSRAEERCYKRAE